RLDRSRLRAVGEPGWVQGDRAHAYPRALAGGVVAPDVEHHLVRVHVVMVVGDRHGLGVEIERARAERADHEVGPLEGLVHRRRRVGALQDRLEIGGVERGGVQAPLPAHHVERVRGGGEAGQAATGADDDRHVLPLREKWALGPPEVTLAVGGVLQELAEGGQIAPWWPDVPARLHRQRAHAGIGGYPAMNGPAWHHDIVTGAGDNRSIDGLEYR